MHALKELVQAAVCEARRAARLRGARQNEQAQQMDQAVFRLYWPMAQANSFAMAEA
ncbi:MAG: hypothetical protein H7143_02405 [Pseudorhodobacter sp.]|nr:hypothetical protein [Rhizobacter sp.]